MLSLLRCRSLLGPSCQLSDAQVEKLKTDLYQFAEVALEGWRQGKKLEPKHALTSLTRLFSNRTHATIAHFPEEDRCQIEERAGILEFDAGLFRIDAERQALLEWTGRGAPAQAGLIERGKKRPHKSRDPR